MIIKLMEVKVKLMMKHNDGYDVLHFSLYDKLEILCV